MPMSMRTRPFKRKRAPVEPSTSKEAREHRNKVFADAYIANGGNESAAARAAGLRGGAGFDLKNRPALLEQIRQRRAELEAKTQLSAELVLGDLKAAQDFDPRSFFREDGSHKHPTELTLEQARQIEGWEVEEVFRGRGSKMLRFRVIKVKLSKRIAVRDQGMRHLGLYAKDNAQRDRDNDPDTLAARTRARLKAIDRSTGGGEE